MKRRFWTAFLAIFCLLVLSSCEKAESFTPEKAQTLYRGASCAGTCEIVSCGDYLAEYRVSFRGGADGWEMEVLAPQSVAGVRAKLDGGRVTLPWEDAALDALLPQEPGLSPADLVPQCLELLGEGAPDAWGEETVDGVPCLLLTFTRETGEGEPVSHRLWLERDSLRLRRAEGWQGETLLLRAAVTDFSLVPAEEPVAPGENL